MYNCRECGVIYQINVEPNPGLWLWHLCEPGSKFTANPKNSNSTAKQPELCKCTEKHRKNCETALIKVLIVEKVLIV